MIEGSVNEMKIKGRKEEKKEQEIKSKQLSEKTLQLNITIMKNK